MSGELSDSHSLRVGVTKRTNARHRFFVEVKTGETRLSPWLAHFQSETGAPHAHQVVMDLPFEQVDCFEAGRPAVVSARGFLSQLL
jgi:hypothetical protein